MLSPQLTRRRRSQLLLSLRLLKVMRSKSMERRLKPANELIDFIFLCADQHSRTPSES